MSRYYSFNAYLRDKYPGQRVYKIALDAGFTCPHRTGPERSGGCIYCENRSFSPNARIDPRPSIAEQVKSGMDFYRHKHQADKFIAYFQAYSNTFAPVELLKQRYDEALQFPDVVGLDIGTRPDCISDEALDLIASYAGKYSVWIEYGLQSAHEKTLEFINRGHTFADFSSAVARTKRRTPVRGGAPHLLIGTHLILGLPGETKDDMMASVRAVVDLGVDSIKLHHLYIAKDTELAKLHARGGVKLLAPDEYIQLLCDILEILPPRMIVQRVTGELGGEYLIAPKWGLGKSRIIQMIDSELTRRGTQQGSKYTPHYS